MRILPDRSSPPALLRYSAAPLLVGVALALTVALQQHIGTTLGLFFWPAVVVAAWFGGTVPGVLAAVLSAAALDWYFYEPTGTFTLWDGAGFMSLVLFVAAAAAVARLTGRLREAERAARESAEAANRHARELELKTEQLSQQTVELELQTEQAQSLAGELEMSNEALEGLAREAEESRDEADRERARLREVLETLPDSTSILDHDWRVQYMNPVAAESVRRIGRDPHSLLGTVIWEQFPELGDSKFYTETVRAQREGKVVEYEEYFAPFDRWSEVRVVPSDDSIVTYSRDITQRKRAEVAIRESESRFRALFEQNPLPMLVFEERTRAVLDVNAAALRGYGYTREEMLALTMCDLHPPESLAAFEDAMRRASGDGLEPHGLFVHRRKDGSSFMVEVTMQAMRYADRDARLAIAVDVTARLRTAERVGRLQRVTAALAHALTREEVADIIVEEGAAALEAKSGVLCLVTPDKQSLEIVRSFNIREDVTRPFQLRPLTASTPLTDAVRERRTIYLENRAAVERRYPGVVAANASAVDASDSWVAVPFLAEGEALGGMTFGFEANRAFGPEERDFVDALARQCAIALERARLLGAEREARAEAETANRAKTDFLAVMSHELRTPLNAIAGHTELVQLGIHGPVTPAQLEALQRVQRSQRHLLGLINDVLNFAKLEAGHVKLAITDVSLASAMLSLEPLVSTQLRAKALRYDHDGCAEERVVRADAEKLQQILLNLLSNAIKFTPDGGEISVSCGADGPVAWVEVRDTGVGIPADRLEAIFAPFVQVDRGLSSIKEGTGLGLAISRDLARAMGGDVTVESTLGEGSCFRLLLPVAGVTGRPAPDVAG